jgi:hypothetical protein
MIRTPKTKSLVPPLTQGEITPLWQRGATCLREAASAKAGGRFSEAYSYFVTDSLAIPSYWYPSREIFNLIF